MTALTVILVIAALIAALLLLRVKIVIEYQEELTLYIRILFFKIKIIPKKEKKIKISDYTKKKIAKRQKLSEEKEKKKKQKKAEKSAAKAEAKKNPKKKEKPPILDTIRLIRVLLSIFLKRFFGHLRIDLARLNITVAADDAAKCAIMYGYICQSVAYTVELLDRFTNLRRNDNTEISVTPDFTSEKLAVDIHIAFSLTIGQVFDILFKTAFGFVKNKLEKI